MIKVIFPDNYNFQDPVASLVDVHSKGVDKSWIEKRASAPGFLETFEKIRPEKDHSLLHLIAMGASDSYSTNRNGDGFYKEARKLLLEEPNWRSQKLANGDSHIKSASTFTDRTETGLIDRYKTFEKFANVYKHHKNKPAKGDKIYGDVKAAAYNEDMDRVELLIQVPNEDWREELEKLANGDGVPFSMACIVNPKTPILTKTGYVPIEDIQIGDYVATHKNRWRKVTKVMRRKYTGPVCKVTMRDFPFTLILTADHPMLASLSRQHAMTLSSSPAGEEMMKNKPIDNMGSDWLHVNHLQTGDWLMCIPPPEFEGFNEVATSSLAYLLGEVLSDASKNLSTFKDPSGKRGIYGGLYNSGYDVKLAYIAALIDSDACVIGPQINWIEIDYHVMLQVRDLLHSCGIWNRILVDTKTVDNKTVPQFKVIIPWEFCRPLIKYSTKLKTPEYLATVMEASDGLAESYDMYLNYQIKRVDIVNLTDTPVYNIEVDEDHSYILAGFVSHNCRVPYDICVPPGTQIVTSEGLKSIETIKVGEKVLTHTGQFKEVYDTFQTFDSTLGYEVSVSGIPQPLTLTHNHPIYALSQVDATTNQIKFARTNSTKNGIEGFLSPTFLAAEDVKVGDFVLFPLTSRDEKDCPILSVDAWLGGLYLGDGHLLFSGGKPSGIQWTLGFDKRPILEKLTEKLEEMGLDVSIKEYEFKKAWAVTCYNVNLAQYIKDTYGYTETKKVPNDAFSVWSKFDQRKLLAGWLDADGSQNNNKYGMIRGCSTLKPLAESLMILANFAECPASTHIQDITSDWAKANKAYIPTFSSTSIEKLQVFSSYMAKSSSVKKRTQHRILTIGGIKYIARRITDIKETYLTEKYNLAVKDDESYVANGIIVHNCSVCGHKGKNRSEYCEHLAKNLGALTKSGHIVTAVNDFPTFFDISRVNRPADRIAWGLVKAASSIIGAADMAIDMGYEDYPDLSIIAASSPRPVADRIELLQKLAAIEKELPVHIHKIKTGINCCGIDDKKLMTLAGKHEKISSLFKALSDQQVLLPLEQFAKIVFGNNEKIAAIAKKASNQLRTVFSKCLTDNMENTVSNLGYNSANTTDGYCEKIASDLAYQLSLDHRYLEKRFIRNILSNTPSNVTENDNIKLASGSSEVKQTNDLLTQYASYELSFILDQEKASNYNRILDSVIAQNLSQV